MANLNSNKYIIEGIKRVDIIDMTTKEIIAHFDITPFDKYCVYCNAHKNCRMTLITDYAGKCNRYPQGPGFIEEDIEYQNELSALANMLYNPNSEIHQQLKELEKFGKLEI